MDLVQKSINAIQQTASQLQKRTVNNFNWAGNQINQNISSIPDKIASIPFNMATNKMNSMIGPPIKDPASNYLYDNSDKIFNNMSPSSMDAYIGLDKEIYRQQKTPSASLMPQYKIPSNKITNVTSDPYLEGIKQKVLSSPNIRQPARDYLKKIPISYSEGNNLPYAGVAVQGPNPQVLINKKYFDSIKNDPNIVPGVILEDTIKHELLHHTPKLLPKELFKPENKKVVDAYTQRWGKQYFNQPGSLVEEMFAENDLPPAYYWHIFKEINPQAKEQDFITALKSYFINNINQP